jgi:hypothetical protein
MRHLESMPTSQEARYSPDDQKKACALMVKYQLPLLTDNDWKLIPPGVLAVLVSRFTASD